MANKTTSEKNKPTRKTLRADEYYKQYQKKINLHERSYVLMSITIPKQNGMSITIKML